MKKLLATVALLLAPTAGFAADLPSRAPAPVPMLAVAPITNWSGLYVGATAGYGWSDNRIETSYDSSVREIAGFLAIPGVVGTFLPAQLGSKTNGGFTGGLTLGYNLQSGNFVYGVEADLSMLSRKSDSFSSVLPGVVQIRPQNGTGPSYSDDTLSAAGATKGSADWLGTLRARAGFALDRAFIYGTGGLAVGGVKSSTSFALNAHCVSVDCSSPNVDTNGVWSGSKSSTKAGWALGGGIEYALTSNISLKAEYLHYDLGKVSYALAADTAGATLLPGTAGAVRARIAGDIVRAGLNYKFGGSAPVVARY